MDSYDITHRGVEGIMFVDGKKLNIQVGDHSIVKTDSVCSVGMVGSERLNIVYMDGERRSIVVKVTSHPPKAAAQHITFGL